MIWSLRLLAVVGIRIKNHHEDLPMNGSQVSGVAFCAAFILVVLVVALSFQPRTPEPEIRHPAESVLPKEDPPPPAAKSPVEPQRLEFSGSEVSRTRDWLVSLAEDRHDHIGNDLAIRRIDREINEKLDKLKDRDVGWAFFVKEVTAADTVMRNARVRFSRQCHPQSEDSYDRAVLRDPPGHVRFPHTTFGIQDLEIPFATGERLKPGECLFIRGKITAFSYGHSHSGLISQSGGKPLLCYHFQAVLAPKEIFSGGKAIQFK